MVLNMPLANTICEHHLRNMPLANLYEIDHLTVLVVVQKVCNIVCACYVEHMPLTSITGLTSITCVQLSAYTLECKHGHTRSHQCRAQALWQ